MQLWTGLIEDCLAAPLSTSSILCRQAAVGLHSVLPAFAQVNEWVLLFSTKQHGHSLQTMLRKAAGHALTILAVGDTSGHVFGCYATSAWEVPGGAAAEFFGGTGECFLWKWEAEDGAEAEGQGGALVKSNWTRTASLFQFGGAFPTCAPCASRSEYPIRGLPAVYVLCVHVTGPARDCIGAACRQHVHWHGRRWWHVRPSP